MCTIGLACVAIGLPPKDIRAARGCVHARDAELRADVPRERARCLHDARLNLHLLRLAVQLPDQVIHLRHGIRNVANDQRIGTVDGHHVAASRQEIA